MNISPETIIERNWEEVKNEMSKTWRKLTEANIDQINNYDDLVNQLKKSYNITEEEVEEKINHFIDKFDLQPNLNRFEELRNSLWETASDAKEKIESTVKNSSEYMKDKTEEWSHATITYAKDNPLKILGLGVLAAVAIKKLIQKKPDIDGA